jgi:hypothetical protein
LPFAVLIIAGEGEEAAGAVPAAMLPVAGQTVLEYQIRRARACGGGHIVVLIDQLPAAMVAELDRLRADGIDVDIAREPRDAADRIHPEEQVLLFAPGFVGTQALVETLVARTKPTLVTLPDIPAYSAFERIDGADRWSGVALLNGQLIRQTAAMLGDWSISSTLMRSALQSGAERWRFEQPDDLAIITNAAQAEAVSARLARDCGQKDQSFFADMVTQPLARLVVPQMFKWAVPFDLVAVMPMILSGSALLLALLGWFATAFALFSGAAVAYGIARMLFDVAVRRSKSLTIFERIKPFVFYALLLLLGWAVSRASGDWTSLLLAGWAASIFLLHPPAAGTASKWHHTPESSAFIMVLALLFAAPVAGLFVILCHGLAGQIAERFFRS